MSQSFTEASTRWCARAAQILGWIPDTFWAATPAELLASLAVPDQASGDTITRNEITEMIERESHG